MSEAPLGRLVVLTDRLQAADAGHDLVDVVRSVADAGADTVLFREKDLPTAERRALGEQVAGALADRSTALVVASDPDLARSLGADGLHLAQADPTPAFTGRRGRSCHDRSEVERAAYDGLDYVSLSPILSTQSKPGHGPPLGVDGIDLVRSVDDSPPAYALGGVTSAAATACIDAGFAGVAVMGDVMRSPDPATTVGALLDAVAVLPAAARRS